ncbi:peptidoglycan-binding protein [Sedimentimonas flavescens]|uniref:Peptidoglycan-binding protein n=1 Tax=Sedimentimonas flavescens TaxID=2851012 RepID=A0ABT2ZV49_9RHOB|nr:peptidoglycan-binding protein [Sedimentimonas flavescens]MCV2877625.1 peptidoglycan-binding protein [Sedimentimonas flavescens]
MPINEMQLASMMGRQPNDNACSVMVSVNKYGGRIGLNYRHRLAHFMAQIMHESGMFKYDKEVWGPTKAQERYDTRTDLGNTPEKDGDGKKYLGRTGIQITGKENTRAFRDWCRSIGLNPPDFVNDPDAMLADPWEGLGPIWYWSTRDLNRYADQNNIEMVTRRINGGLNGFDDRVRLYTRAALVLAGYMPDDVKGFQRAHGLLVDGIAGPKTRDALHDELSRARPPIDYVEEPEVTQPASSGLFAALIAAIVAILKAIFGAKK